MNGVWMLVGNEALNGHKKLYFGNSKNGAFKADGDYTAHMQMQDLMPVYDKYSIICAGSVKAGTLYYNSLFNDKHFCKEMNDQDGPTDQHPQDRRAELKAKTPDTPCDPKYKPLVEKLFKENNYLESDGSAPGFSVGPDDLVATNPDGKEACVADGDYWSPATSY
eukprot:CAMPEP_0119301114 /NCGR_PEP_ID=MMETSP1333-20130426/2941_1 /TAXON_ID=418940 /ORGANISM="Scyphosphaera apsteinii, Strain RCC1455" /LENGTH=164 /DNA_ID=CAMNT_0007303095 /DNA_START=77 /DNA_END=571 /DNA_ORIENTATION=-